MRRIAALVALLLTGCTGSTEATPEPVVPFLPPAVAPVKALGAAEKSVEVLAPQGLLAADADWVKKFTANSGCAVSVAPYSTTASLRGQASAAADVIAAPSFEVLNFVGDGAVAPVNPDLLPGLAGLREDLVAPQWSTVDGVSYGIAIGRGVFGADALPLPADETVLAAAALSIEGVEDPFAIDRDQLATAALTLQDSPAGGSTEVPADSLGTSLTWLLAAEPVHPTCAYRFLQAATAPAANRALATAAGQEPAVAAACPATKAPAVCARSGDEAYWEQVRIAITPLQECWDGREVRCTDLADWTTALRDAEAGRISTPSPT